MQRNQESHEDGESSIFDGECPSLIDAFLAMQKHNEYLYFRPSDKSGDELGCQTYENFQQWWEVLAPAEKQNWFATWCEETVEMEKFLFGSGENTEL